MLLRAEHKERIENLENKQQRIFPSSDLKYTFIPIDQGQSLFQ
jgi:hypothetical protein